MTENKRLYHVSEEEGIQIFKPKPSPSFFEDITGDVVFAISETLLHNYLLPRDCPRVTFYAGKNTSQIDKELFFGRTTADFIIAVESGWWRTIQQTKLYCYEFPSQSFRLLDECAGYYISDVPVQPISVDAIDNIPEELLKRNIELRIIPNLWKLADAVVISTLSFSLIRMRNAALRHDFNVKKTL